jgi:hypothetical protein
LNVIVNIINRPDNNIQKLDRTLFGIQSLVIKIGSLFLYTNIKYRTTTESNVYIRNSGK